MSQPTTVEPEYIETDDGLIEVEHAPNGEDDYDVIPTSYLEDKVRHILVRDLDTDIRYFYDRETGSMSETSVF